MRPIAWVDIVSTCRNGAVQQQLARGVPPCLCSAHCQSGHVSMPTRVAGATRSLCALVAALLSCCGAGASGPAACPSACTHRRSCPVLPRMSQRTALLSVSTPVHTYTSCANGRQPQDGKVCLHRVLVPLTQHTRNAAALGKGHMQRPRSGGKRAALQACTDRSRDALLCSSTHCRALQHAPRRARGSAHDSRQR